MTERIQEFLRNRRNEGHDVEPCLVVDLEVVRDNYQTFSKALPDSRVFYAVKANPAPEVLSLLASMGSCFDCASVVEIQMALAAGASPDRSRTCATAAIRRLRNHRECGRTPWRRAQHGRSSRLRRCNRPRTGESRVRRRARCHAPS